MDSVVCYICNKVTTRTRKKLKLKKYSATASLTFNSPKHPCFTASGYCLSQSVPWDAGVMGPVD